MKPWSDEDKALLREHYPKTGTMALRDMMPDRTIRQIRAMASLLGLFVDLKKETHPRKRRGPKKRTFIFARTIGGSEKERTRRPNER